MTPRDRFLTTLRGGLPDRVPLSLEGLHFASREALAALPDAAWREVAERVYDQTHFMVNFPTYVNRYLVTPAHAMRTVGEEQQGENTITTVEIATPGGALTAITGRNAHTNTTWQVKYPVESLEDLDKLRAVPWERPAGLRPPDRANLPAEFATRGIIHIGVSSPMVCVAGAMSYEYFLELCATELPLIEDLTAQCLERTLDALDVVLAERTVEICWMGGCEWLTPPMASPRLYAALVQPYEAPIIARLHAAGALSHVHCHGCVRDSLPLVIERGADYLEPMEPPPDGDITMVEAKATAAGRITLGGNIEARVLENESADAVEAAVRAAFAGGGHRMVLATTAGPLGEMTSRMRENYHRLLDVWEELSPLGASTTAS